MSLLNAEELGKIYGRTGRQMLRWLKDGKIPAAVNQGRTIRFDPEEVAAALKKSAAKKARVNKLPLL